jgi:hypothetical protein
MSTATTMRRVMRQACPRHKPSSAVCNARGMPNAMHVRNVRTYLRTLTIVDLSSNETLRARKADAS